jgi:hypothetical protein
MIDPLNAELNPIWNLLALLGAHLIFHIGFLRVKDPVYTQKIFLSIYPINYGIIQKEFCGTSDIYTCSCSHNTLLIAEPSKSAVVTLDLALGIIW